MYDLKYFFKKIKKFFKKPTIKIIFISFSTVVLTLFVIFSILWMFRLEIFDYISLNYIKPREILSTKVVGMSGLNDKSVIQEEIANAFAQKGEKNKQGSIVEAVKKANPAVVSVVLIKEVPKYDVSYTKEYVLDKNGNKTNVYVEKPVYTPNGVEEKRAGSGSGFIVTQNGLIITNNHVVSSTDVKYKVFLNDGHEYSATVLARDNVLDLAVLKINATGLPYLAIGDSDKLEVGQSVVAIGNALGEFKNTVSSGVISGLSRSIVAGSNFGISERLDKVIQTDAAINPGNSGGPLINLKGEVVGVNVAVVENSSNIGFSIPVNSVKDIISDVSSFGKIIRPYVGIRYLVIDQEVKAKYNLSVDYGIFIQKGQGGDDLAVLLNSPAEKVGLKEGDIILAINGEKITSENDFATMIRNKKVGETILLWVISNGAEKNLSLKLEQIPDNW